MNIRHFVMLGMLLSITMTAPLSAQARHHDHDRGGGVSIGIDFGTPAYYTNRYYDCSYYTYDYYGNPYLVRRTCSSYNNYDGSNYSTFTFGDSHHHHYHHWH